MSEKISLQQLQDLIDKQKEEQTVLDQVAQRKTQGQPWRNPTDTNSTFEYAMGRGATPAQQQGLNQLYNSVLNKPRGQTTIGAVTDGIGKGGALMDQLRAKRKAEDLAGAQSKLTGAKNQYESAKDVYGLQQKEDEIAYQKKRDEIKDSQWKTEQEKEDETKIFANQVKYHQTLSTEIGEHDAAGGAAQQLADELEAFGKSGGSGLGSTISEFMKKNVGFREAVSVMRTKAAKVINMALVGNLPPGIASDRDIEIIAKGFPPANASMEELKEFAQAMADVEKKLAGFKRKKERWMSTHEYDLRGFQEAYDKERAQEKNKATEYTPAVNNYLEMARKNIPQVPLATAGN